MHRLARGTLVLGLLLVATAADGATLDLDETGAALALPIFTGSGVETHAIVTNGLDSGVRLDFNLIAGEGINAWETSSFSCFVTAHETTHIVATASAGGSRLDFECSSSGATPSSPDELLNIPRDEFMDSPRGILFVAVSQGGVTSSANALLGSATVIDAAQGLAWSFGAIAFQGEDPLAQDGDRDYRFDGLEYAQFPDLLVTDFLAPRNGVTAELVLFTLDGTADVRPVPVSLRAFFVDDDERIRDGNVAFDCFTVLDLRQTGAGSVSSRAGHLTLTPRDVSVPTVHDLGPSADGFRNTPAHGWLVQTFDLGGAGTAAVARTLVQGTDAHVPLAGDIVRFDAR